MISNNENLLRLNPSIKDAKIKVGRASSFLNTSKIILNKLGQEKEIDKNLIYTNIYDAIRIACEGLLLLKGYKVKKGENHHFNVINSAKQILPGELINEFSRLQKMRNSRNKIDYGIMIISESSLNQAIKDADLLLNRITELIEQEDSQNTLI